MYYYLQLPLVMGNFADCKISYSARLHGRLYIILFHDFMVIPVVSVSQSVLHKQFFTVPLMLLVAQDLPMTLINLRCPPELIDLQCPHQFLWLANLVQRKNRKH